MKKHILISLFIIIILLCVVITVLFKNDNSYCFDKTYITEYGDTFRVTCDDYLHNITIMDENDFYTVVQYFNEDEGIIPIYNDGKMRCYLVGHIIIFYNSVAKGERFNGDLYSKPEMIPIVKSVLLHNNAILQEYLPFFLSIDRAEILKMLQNLIDRNYDELSVYGLSLDESSIESMIYTANQYLN